MSKTESKTKSMTRIPAALCVFGAILLGAPAMAAPVTPLSGAAKPMAQENDLVQARFGWHWGWGHSHRANYRCRPYCGWGG
ncbi:hypothetical protein XI06_35490 [Bradyrhizobium sp. CCBAU 11434]|uniref:hypothetical protein n=1 Tax=Bradyrhizobium sp. CCBAU 11434 TaxID=1630885 RepID=UPI0023064813|nr:hypothetical protein [Bradyrhizobium sp. CCBAU 11434]MDA9525479.1 hypothetical protein [Bradyrhizobium sp. CCBAU 11434]